MSETGYLQTKIQENKIEAENLKKTMFELQRKINILENNILDGEKRTQRLQDELKEKLEEINPKQLKKSICMISNDAVTRYSEKAIKSLKKELDSARNDDKVILTDMQKKLLARLSDMLVESIDIFLTSVAENQVEFHKILLENNLIDKPFEKEFVLHVNPYGSTDSILIIDFPNNSVDVQHGKDIATKFAKKKLIHTKNPRKPIERIHPKAGKKILGTLREGY